MRVLLTDGSGLTSRQCATLLARAGHDVGVVTPSPITLARMTSAVRWRHAVPKYGLDPLAWTDAALAVLDEGRYDVLLPTQEQVAALSLVADSIAERGVGVAVPTFAALRRVQDKVSAEDLLIELGLPRLPSSIARTADELASAGLPAYLKAPIATASTGVRYVADADDLPDAAATMRALNAYALGGVLVQSPVPGPLLMVQAVLDDGRLIAVHANRRDRVGAGGGASRKTSVATAHITPIVERIGAALRWHGALSLDVIDGPDGPIVIDVNPRLVEPGNAAAAGLDLVGALLDVSLRRSPESRRAGRVGVQTSQLLIAMLDAAQRSRRRRLGVARELAAAAVAAAVGRGAREELTPVAGDLTGAAWVAGLSAALMVAPGLARQLSGDSVGNYALTPAGWRQLLACAPPSAPIQGLHATTPAG